MWKKLLMFAITSGLAASALKQMAARAHEGRSPKQLAARRDPSVVAAAALPDAFRAFSRAFTRLPASVLERLKRIDSLSVSTMWQ